MAALHLRVWLFAATLQLWITWSPHSAAAIECENLTRDIKESLKILRIIAYNVQQSAVKLESYNTQEKYIWVNLKSILTALDRNSNGLEPLSGVISGLDKRLANLETELLHKEERENKTQKETNEALKGITKSIQTLTSTVESFKINKYPIVDNIPKDDSLQGRLEIANSKIDDVKHQIKNFTNNFNEKTLRSVCFKAMDTNPFKKHIEDVEELLYRYELKLDVYNGKTANISEVALADGTHHDILQEMKRQGEEITKIQKLLSDAEGLWKVLPKLSDFHDLQASNNQTLDAVIKATESLNETSEASMGVVRTELRELSGRLVATNESLQRSVVQGTALADRVFGDISTGLDALQAQVQSLMRSEIVIRETADDVRANKKSIMSSASRVVAQLGQLVLQLGRAVNDTLDSRMDNIETSLTGNLKTWSSKVESSVTSHMTQLWRQVGVMHDQLAAGRRALDTLANQTDKYIVSSTTTLRDVKKDMSVISTGTTALSDNLNDALARLRHSTKELGRISGALGDVMVSLKNDVHAMHAKIDAVVPGLGKSPVRNKGN